MWDRVVFKDRAKAIMKEHYWKVFIACLIGSLLNVTSSGSIDLNLNLNSSNIKSLSNLGHGIPLNPFAPGVYGRAAALMLVLTVIILIFSVIAVVLTTFVFNPLRVGFCRYLVLTQQYGRPAEIGEIFWGFSCGHYLNLVKTMFFMDLYCFLWSLLFIIPGIVKAYEYTCVPYILAQHPDMNYREVLSYSKSMTNGHKFDIFVLRLSFIGWEFLGALLFGIGVLFVTPYIELTNGEMYAYLRRRIFFDQTTGHGGSYQDHDSYSQDYSQDYSHGYT